MKIPKKKSLKPTYLEDHPRTDGYVVNNHGDRFRPLRIGLFFTPSKFPKWLINGADPNHLLNGMILRVPGNSAS